MRKANPHYEREENKFKAYALQRLKEKKQQKLLQAQILIEQISRKDKQILKEYRRY